MIEVGAKVKVIREYEHVACYRGGVSRAVDAGMRGLGSRSFSWPPAPTSGGWGGFYPQTSEPGIQVADAAKSASEILLPPTHSNGHAGGNIFSHNFGAGLSVTHINCSLRHLLSLLSSLIIAVTETNVKLHKSTCDSPLQKLLVSGA